MDVRLPMTFIKTGQNSQATDTLNDYKHISPNFPLLHCIGHHSKNVPSNVEYAGFHY